MSSSIFHQSTHAACTTDTKTDNGCGDRRAGSDVIDPGGATVREGDSTEVARLIGQLLLDAINARSRGDTDVP